MGDPVRALVLTPEFPPVHGGINRLMHRIAENATQTQVRVVTFDAPAAREFDRGLSFPVSRVPESPRGRRFSVPRLNLAALREAGRFRPHVVLSGHVVTSPAAWIVAKSLGAGVVQYLYAEEVSHRPRLSSFAVRRADLNVVISSYTRDLALGLGAPPERLRLIPPGVDRVARSGPQRAERPTLVTIGRLGPDFKGHDVVIRALPAIREQIPDVEWVVIGDGPLRSRLERLAHEAGITSHVRFLGALGDAERDHWLNEAHVFVMPARVLPGGVGGEGFGIVYLEAAAHGLPSIAGNVGGAVDAVIDHQTGLLVDPQDPDAVAEAAVELLADRELAQQLGRRAEEHARRFAWPVIAQRVEQLLHDVAKAGGPA